MSDLSRMTCIEDLRQQARRRVPTMFYEYADTGSWTESTYHANEHDFARLKFRQRVAVDITQRELQSTLLGQPVRLPLAFAPTGLTGMQWADGEILAAQACQQFGVPFTLSTMSICSIEDVAAHTTAPFWFQLYVMRDRDFMERLIDRAKAAQCSALIVTLDLQVMGQRHRDIKNGLTTPPKLTVKNMLDLVSRPRWCLNILRTPRRGFGNIVGHVQGISDMSSLAAWTSEQFDPGLCWEDVAWIKERWGGKLVLKGIMDADDARQAVQTGADALIVSNHGGRQLDGAPSSIAALPHIVQAVGNDIEVWMDGGVRSGQDVLRALALGAKGVLAGRALLYGLGAAGRPGVLRALEILRHELDMSMAFCGHNDVRTLDRSILLNPQVFDDLRCAY